MEEIEKTLKSLSDDEKIDKLKEESRYTYIRMLIMSLNSDELKLQMIDKLKDSHKAELIESMQSDDLKMQSLSFFDNYKQEIIISMKSDEKKIEAMKKYIESSSQCREIIESLSLPENKIANLYLLDTPYDIQKVLKNIKIENDEQRLKVAQSVKNEYIATDFIKAITDEKIRIQALNTLTDDFSKVKIINTLQDEDKKIEELEKLNNERAKAIIIRNLQDEDKKMEAIEKITDEAIKVDIIINLQNEDKKIEAIEKITDELTKSSIIESLQDEDKKKQEMEKLTNEHAKAKIISSLKDENKKIEELGKITNEYAKVEIINSIKNEDKKKEEIGKLNDELAKAICTELTQNNEGKIPLEKALKNLLEENRNYSEIGLDKNLTIGIEIESEGEMSKIIHKIGDINNKQASGKTSTWKAIPDESLREGEGVEVVSPILTDNKEDVEEIYSICTMLQKCGQSISENCGGHVHIGADYLTSKEAYIYLRDYKAISFLKENYEAEHTVSLDDAIEDIGQICINNGGNIK